jgi:hypothetical protein
MIQYMPNPRPLAPSDLDVLERALDAACERRGIDKAYVEAEYIAAELVQLYEHGVRNEVELSALIS